MTAPNKPLPTVFISHGAPTLIMEPGPARDVLSRLGRELPRPRAILAISAHWLSLRPRVSASAHPETIHDFGGFPRELYQLRYPAPGAPDLAARVQALTGGAGLAMDIDPDRGLDHGAWVPLMLMYPEADIPVAQLALQLRDGPRHHYALGRALRPLAREGVLILASGGLTHNLHEFGHYAYDDPPPDWVQAFRTWMQARLEAGDVDALLDYRALTPHAERNHPTDEHLLPLYVALGAAEEPLRVRHLEAGVTYGVISMDGFVFGPAIR